MKRFLFILVAVTPLMMCSCEKLNQSINDLENRISQNEKQISDLNDQVDALQQLIDALASGLSINEVKPVAGGFRITFSDGSTYTVVNGKDSNVSYSEDYLCYYFNFGKGNSVAISKSGALGIRIKAERYDLSNRQVIEIPYQVIGRDQHTQLVVEPCPYDVEITDSALKVSADEVVSGRLVFKAIRNTDGAVSAVLISINKVINGVSFEVSVNDIAETGAKVSITPSELTVPYMMMVQPKSYVDQFETAEELIAADMEAIAVEVGPGKTEEQYKAFVLGVLCGKGAFNSIVEPLLPNTEYIVYAFGLDENLGILGVSEMVSFKTKEETVIIPDEPDDNEDIEGDDDDDDTQDDGEDEGDQQENES